MNQTGISPLQKKLGTWAPFLQNEFKQDYMKRLSLILERERKHYTIWPASEDVFKCFQLTPIEEVRVVIIGQDPYPHSAANGLCFSLKETINTIPASLRNIFKEIETDVGFKMYHDPDLTRWAEQGVLLLNRVLTVRDGRPKSHANIGWEQFTSKVIETVSDYHTKPIVFLLWGADAMKSLPYIKAPHHYLYASHPSPLSANRGFFGSRHFSRTNEFLKIHYQKEIEW